MTFEEWYKTLKVCELEQPLWVAKAAWEAAQENYKCIELIKSCIGLIKSEPIPESPPIHLYCDTIGL